MHLLSLVVAAASAVASAKTLVGIPTFDFNVTSTAQFSLTKITQVLVDSRFQNAVDPDGTTLIPPTLLAFGKTFAADLGVLGLKVSAAVADAAQPNSVFLTIANGSEVFLDAAGRSTSEGYRLSVTTNGVVIEGASPLGAWWGTRTLMQQAKLGGVGLEVPIGEGKDAPGWGTRGVMVGVASLQLKTTNQ